MGEPEQWNLLEVSSWDFSLVSCTSFFCLNRSDPVPTGCPQASVLGQVLQGSTFNISSLLPGERSWPLVVGSHSVMLPWRSELFFLNKKVKLWGEPLAFPTRLSLLPPGRCDRLWWSSGQELRVEHGSRAERKGWFHEAIPSGCSHLEAYLCTVRAHHCWLAGQTGKWQLEVFPTCDKVLKWEGRSSAPTNLPWICPQAASLPWQSKAFVLDWAQRWAEVEQKFSKCFCSSSLPLTTGDTGSNTVKPQSCFFSWLPILNFTAWSWLVD